MGFIIFALACVLLTRQPHDTQGNSDKDHYKHDVGHEHNLDYDHKAFLGKEEAHSYDEKSAEESKRMLGVLFHKVDADGDGQVTIVEMMKWIHLKQEKDMKKNTAVRMKQVDENSDGYLSWDEYEKKTYGFLDTNATAKEHYAHLVAQDGRRFTTADVDGDKILSADEFYAFFNPETRDHMKPIVTKETLEDMDKNHDGYVSLEEYVADYWPLEERVNVTTEPDWVKEEKKKFSNTYDKNKDGKLDENEVKEYIFPSEDAHVKQEANHLITESDNNGDGNISKDEMLENYQTFVGSQATDFGNLFRDTEDL